MQTFLPFNDLSMSKLITPVCCTDGYKWVGINWGLIQFPVPIHLSKDVFPQKINFNTHHQAHAPQHKQKLYSRQNNSWSGKVREMWFV